VVNLLCWLLQCLREPLTEVFEVFKACQKVGILASLFNGRE
jgi:hypothetical protein